LSSSPELEEELLSLSLLSELELKFRDCAATAKLAEIAKISKDKMEIAMFIVDLYDVDSGVVYRQ